MLTDPTFIQRLESLYLLARKVLGGTLQADRRTAKRGTGITFADYAEYYFGADYRLIDWRVFARFETLVVKLFELEEDATIHILLDCSRSMESKFVFARQLAASLGYIGLLSLDRVAVYSLSDTFVPLLESCRGRGHALRFLTALEHAPLCGSDTRFHECCRIFQARSPRKGITIVLSDFLFPDGFEEGLQYLRYHKHDVYCLQIQDERDTHCHLQGDVDLFCVESGRHQRTTITAREARRYEQLVRDWNERLQQSCARQGIGLAYTTTDIPFDVVIQDILRRGGLVA